jgi:hypothetical protein
MRLEKITIAAVAVAAVAAALCIATHPVSVLAQEGRAGILTAHKDCSTNNGNAGDFCTFITSNLNIIPKGAKLYNMQGALPALGNIFDTNVILNAGNGNVARGRCTLPIPTAGMCSFSDGTGNFAGFTARVNSVSMDGGNTYVWTGTYKFESLLGR